MKLIALCSALAAVVLLSTTMNSNRQQPGCISQAFLPTNDRLKRCLLPLSFDGNISFEAAVSGDYGNMKQSRPGAVLYPRSTNDIVVLMKAINSASSSSSDSLCKGFKVAARGNGHSINGQSQVPDGHIIVEMRALAEEDSRRSIHIHRGGGESLYHYYADVSGGSLWSEVLEGCLEEKLSPMSWTDYLGLTVGGTLSNAGVSGQTSRYGPQISNVLQLQVVTGEGEVEICSKQKNPDLFNAVLGGLGQFGIITQARIRLQKAPLRVRWIRSLYDDVVQFTKDQEWLIRRSANNGLDYLEGFVVLKNEEDPINGWRSLFPKALVNSLLNPTQETHRLMSTSTGPVLYCMEIAKYYYNLDQIMDPELESLVSSLGHIPSFVFSEDVPYKDFLNRVKLEEETKDERGKEVKVPHPWINLFVPANKILEFDSVVFKNYLKEGAGGPVIVYPLNQSKWDQEMSAIVPNHEVFYMVAILRTIEIGKTSIQNILQQNKEILEFSLTPDIGAKQYLASHANELEWKKHYASKWHSILEKKTMFDPLHILSPGQKIFFKFVDTF